MSARRGNLQMCYLYTGVCKCTSTISTGVDVKCRGVRMVSSSTRGLFSPLQTNAQGHQLEVGRRALRCPSPGHKTREAAKEFLLSSHIYSFTHWHFEYKNIPFLNAKTEGEKLAGDASSSPCVVCIFCGLKGEK